MSSCLIRPAEHGQSESGAQRMKQKRKIGVIADDFTGASDAASFLAKSGARVIMCNEGYPSLKEPFDALVIALKSRSAPPAQALAQTKEALTFLRQCGCDQFYFKYCSTFDSTPQGNIGVVMDYLVQALQVPYSILCPALPVNGRSVKAGILYVNGQPLSESPMKDHPLNPMWDSYIPALMKPQSQFPCELLETQSADRQALQQLITAHAGTPFYIIPDYTDDAQGAKIAELFGDLTLLSGGSGLLEYLYQGERHAQGDAQETHAPTRTLLLCASCSLASKRQVRRYQQQGGITFAVDANKLLDGTLQASDVFARVREREEATLVYSDAIDHEMQKLRASASFAAAGKAMEAFMAEMSQLAYAAGFERIVVAGGETSGAVIQALGLKGFFIERSIDPGVPILRPLENKACTLVLKSGNFGSEDFFSKACC